MDNEFRLTVLRENFKQNEGGLSLREYTEREAEYDPRFFNWFFNDSVNVIDDFGKGMTEDQKREWKEFLELL